MFKGGDKGYRLWLVDNGCDDVWVYDDCGGRSDLQGLRVVVGGGRDGFMEDLMGGGNGGSRDGVDWRWCKY